MVKRYKFRIQCNCRPGGCSVSEAYDKFNHAIFEKRKAMSYDGAFQRYSIILVNEKENIHKHLITNNDKSDGSMTDWITVSPNLQLGERYFQTAFSIEKVYFDYNIDGTQSNSDNNFTVGTWQTANSVKKIR